MKVTKPKRSPRSASEAQAGDDLVQVRHTRGVTKNVQRSRLRQLGPKWQVVADEPPVTTPEPIEGSDTKE